MSQYAHKNIILLSVIAVLLTWTACSSKSTRTVYKAGYDYRYTRAPAYIHYPQRYRYYQRYSTQPYYQPRYRRYPYYRNYPYYRRSGVVGAIRIF